MDHETIKQFEREFFLVWKVLSLVRPSIARTDPLRDDLDHASATLLELMRSSDCIDPSIALNGLSGLQPPSSGF